MSGIPGTTVVQVTNLSSAVSSEQMRTLFGFLGDIEELRLYPPEWVRPSSAWGARQHRGLVA